MKPPRTPWTNFPDVLIHAGESAVKQHPVYQEAKTGDDNAARALVIATINPAQVEKLAALLRGRSPVLVSAHAYERQGVNAIPEAFADELARQAEFEGPIRLGVEYVMVDDFVGMGGTLANLRGHIEAGGGKVVAAVALTASHIRQNCGLNRTPWMN
jgi:hypothetical protein